MIYACYCSLPIVIIRDAFFFMPEIILQIRLSVLYHNLLKSLSFYHILIDAD